MQTIRNERVFAIFSHPHSFPPRVHALNDHDGVCVGFSPRSKCADSAQLVLQYYIKGPLVLSIKAQLDKLFKQSGAFQRY